MGDKDDELPGPSRSQKRKYEDIRPMSDAQLLKLLEEGLSDLDDEDFDDNYIPDDLISSDSEEEIEELIPQETINDPARENISWEDNSESITVFPFTKTDTLLEAVPGNEPIHYFRHILTDRFLDDIIVQTNSYAVELLLRPTTKEKSRITRWKDVTRDEILIFLGLLLHMGNIRLNRIQDYWKTDYLFRYHVFADNMSRNRFLLILRVLHFARNPQDGEPTPADRLYKVRGIVNFFNLRMSEIFYPGRELSLDESMVLWRGRLSFRQYIKNKRHRYGMKLYMLTTPGGIVLKFMVYTGMLDDCGGKGHAEKVVCKLLEGLFDVGHSLYMDNYYNSYELARRLAAKQTHCTGTMRTNRKSFPTEVKNKKLKKNETVAKYANSVMMGKWKDKRDVAYISTEYKNDMVEIQTRRGENKVKPLPITQYNKYMSGVDKQDQMLAYHPGERKSLRWPTKIFGHILQLMMLNAHQLYNKYSSKNIPLYEFRLSVIRELLKESPANPIPKPAASLHVLKIREEKKARKTLRKQCKNCYSQGKRKDTMYVCSTCPGNPGYCLDCATITHD